MPIKRYMQICLGMIGMPPSDFWGCSVIEIHLAIEGFMEFNTTEKDEPLVKDELAELMELNPD